MRRNELSKRRLPVLLSLLALSVCANTSALPEDRDKPISIESDRAVRSERDGMTVYIGNVELVQGALLFKADRLEIYSTKNEVDRVIGYGNPAYVEDTPDPDKPAIELRANTISYFVQKEELHLEQQASIMQDGATVESDNIVYLMQAKVVQADSSDQSGRVKMVIPARAAEPGT